MAPARPTAASSSTWRWAPWRWRKGECARPPTTTATARPPPSPTSFPGNSNTNAVANRPARPRRACRRFRKSAGWTCTPRPTAWGRSWRSTRKPRCSPWSRRGSARKARTWPPWCGFCRRCASLGWFAKASARRRRGRGARTACPPRTMPSSTWTSSRGAKWRRWRAGACACCRRKATCARRGNCCGKCACWRTTAACGGC